MTPKISIGLVCLGITFGWQSATAGPPGTFTLRLVVDQFGYRPNLPKVAVVSDPQTGFNADESYTPGATLEVRTWSSNTVVFSGAPVAWSNGTRSARSASPTMSMRMR